jgi:integrase
MLTVAAQLDEDGGLAPIKYNRRRTIEITRSLADDLAAGPEMTFGHLTHALVDHAWQKARKAAGIDAPLPTIHDLRHTHVSALIADGWDAVEIANRIGDTLETTLRVYAHEFDVAPRSKDRRERLEAREAARMATSKPQQTATERPRTPTEVADLQAIRRRAS